MRQSRTTDADEVANEETLADMVAFIKGGMQPEDGPLHSDDDDDDKDQEKKTLEKKKLLRGKGREKVMTLFN